MLPRQKPTSLLIRGEMEGTTTTATASATPQPGGGGGGMVSPPFQSLPSKIKVKAPAGAESASSTTSTRKQRRTPPNPKELVSHYEKQGMDTQTASLRVIQDLQNIVFKVVSSSKGPGASASADGVINGRLAKLEMKLDSKPGYVETLAIGIASGAVLNGIGSVLPHVASAFANIWNSVRGRHNP